MKKENIKIDVKKVSIESLIRKEKYIDQFKDLVLESKKIGKVYFLSCVWAMGGVCGAF